MSMRGNPQEEVTVKSRFVFSLVVILVLCGLLIGCSISAEEAEPDGAVQDTSVVEVTDLAGRTVEVPQNVERIAAIGAGTLRLMCYAGVADMVAGIEEFETKEPLRRPYTLANPALLELPIIGIGGPDSSVDAERLLGIDPDVIFVAQLADGQAADELQAATGIPVLVLSYGQLGNFNDAVKQSLDIVGIVTGSQERTDEVIAFVEATLDDLAARTVDAADADRPTCYVGALGFKGLHGIESTQGDYPPFSSIAARNVLGELEQTGSVMIDKEQLLEWDPEYVFIDRYGLSLVHEDVAVNKPLYEGLTAVREGRVFAQLPFNNYWTNIEVALADAYYAGTVMFPEAFADIDPAAKADELSIALLDAPVYDRLVEIYGGGFGPIDLLESKE